MKCRIQDFDTINKIYTLEFPDGKVLRYKINIGRNCLVGEFSQGHGRLMNIYYYKLII